MADAVFSTAWIAFGLAIIIGSQTLRDPADRFPTLAGVIVVAMAGLRIIELARGEVFRFSPTEPRDVRNTWWLFWGLWVLAALIVLLGLVWGGSLWAIAFLMVLYRWSLMRSLIYSGAFMVAIAFLFPALGLHLPGGILLGR